MEEAESVAAMDAAAPALHKMERAAIAAGSHITYNPEELLGLIRDHLLAAGLAQTAEVLEHEAGLDAARFSRSGAAGEKSMWSRQQSGESSTARRFKNVLCEITDIPAVGVSTKRGCRRVLLWMQAWCARGYLSLRR